MRFLHRLIRSLILPNNAAPGDPAIILGPDLPPCMQPYYSSAIFFRPPGSNTGANAPPYYFMAQSSNGPTETVDVGYLVYDGTVSGVCGFIVNMSYRAQNNGAGVTTTQLYFGELFSAGAASFNLTPTLILQQGNVSRDSASFETWDGRGVGRGIRSFVMSTSNSSVTAGEIVDLTLPNTTYRQDRQYEIRVGGLYTMQGPGGAGIVYRTLLRKGTTTAGAIVMQNPVSSGVGDSGQGITGPTVGMFRCNTDITTQLVLTLDAAGVTAQHLGGANSPRYVGIWDVGTVSDFAIGSTPVLS